MWMVSSCLPIPRGVYCTTLEGVMSTCVGKRWLPLLNRLARNTSPEANGWPFRQIENPSSTSTPPARATAHQIHCVSLVTTVDVKLFSADRRCPLSVVELSVFGRSPLLALPRPWFAREVPAPVPLGETHSLLPAPGQPRHPASDRRGLPGVQRRTPLGDLSDLR